MAINAIIRFLQAARSMAQRGMKKEQILDFARREFGEVSKLLKKQIDDIFKAKPKTEKKGDVVPIKKKVDLSKYDDEALNRLVDEDIMLRGEADTLSDFGKDYGRVKEIEKRRKEIREILEAAQKNPELVGGAKEGIMATDEAADMVKGEINPKTNQMPDQQRQFLGFPNRSVEAIVRAAARDVLEKAGLGPRIKGQDPIDMARQIYGEDFLDALDNISGELLEASSYPEISRILTEKKIYNFKPRQGLDIKQKGEIEDITAFDPEGRDPNADGGLINILKL